jgi:hypothetical protein
MLDIDNLTHATTDDDTDTSWSTHAYMSGLNGPGEDSDPSDADEDDDSEE